MTSAVLYFISFFSSLYTNNFVWKLLNGILIVSSYFSDVYTSKFFNDLDYLCVMALSLCYIDIMLTSVVICLSAVIEMYTSNTFETAKNISFVIALIKCMTVSFSYGFLEWFALMFFSIIGVIIYKIRYVHCERNDFVLYDFLTFLWRICSLFVLISANYTIYMDNLALIESAIVWYFLNFFSWM
jgi:hypothetical protein